MALLAWSRQGVDPEGAGGRGRLLRYNRRTVHRRFLTLTAIVLVLAAGAAVWRLEPQLLAVKRHAAAVTHGSIASHTPSLSAGSTTPSAPPAAGLSFSTSWLARHPQADLHLASQAAVLLDVDTRQVLWERDASGRRAPASLAKLITAMVTADVSSLDRQVGVTAATDMESVQRIEPDSTVMGLTAGEVLTVRELLVGLFLRSGNDAAETLATIEGRDQFIQLMNRKAAELGMTGSHFSSPIGLDAPDMYTTAYDLGLAAAAIVLHYPTLLAISGTPFVHLDQTQTHKAYDLVNYNKLVIPDQPKFYPGATGMKTAFTDDAGPCMVAAAERGGRRLVAVILHSDVFFDDAHALLDYGFSVHPS